MKKSYIPNIRFTKFFNIWDIKKLKQIGLIKKGQQINKLKLKETGKYYVLNGGISPSGYFDMYNTPMNTISISEGGNSCGFVTLNKEHFWSGGHNYTLSNLSIDTNYLFQYLKKQEQFIMTLRTGSGLPNIQKSRLENIIIFFPQKEEQIKLSKFFLDLDVLIQQQKIKLEYLNQLKKAMLEKMFPKENSNIPKLRFKGFTETWEQRELKELGKILTGSTPSTSNPNYYSKIGIPWVTPTDIKSVTISETPRKLSKEGENIGRIVPANTILCTCIASIGKNTLLTVKGSFNQQINSLTPNKENNAYFLLTESNFWSDKMKKITTSGMMQIINKSEFSNLQTMIPILKEQQKIGDFFLKIDSLITLHQYMYNKLFQVKNNIFTHNSTYYSNILHNLLSLIFTYTQPQYKLHTKKNILGVFLLLSPIYR